MFDTGIGCIHCIILDVHGILPLGFQKELGDGKVLRSVRLFQHKQVEENCRISVRNDASRVQERLLQVSWKQDR